MKIIESIHHSIDESKKQDALFGEIRSILNTDPIDVNAYFPAMIRAEVEEPGYFKNVLLPYANDILSRIDGVSLGSKINSRFSVRTIINTDNTTAFEGRLYIARAMKPDGSGMRVPASLATNGAVYLIEITGSSLQEIIDEMRARFNLGVKSVKDGNKVTLVCRKTYDSLNGDGVMTRKYTLSRGAGMPYMTREEQAWLRANTDRTLPNPQAN